MTRKWTKEGKDAEMVRITEYIEIALRLLSPYLNNNNKTLNLLY